MNVVHQLRCRLADVRGRGVYAGWPNEHNAIFIHLPKTAGTSMSRALGLSGSRHIPAEAYRIANPKKFANFFKFAVVRNPYDRLYSSYAFLLNGGLNDDDARFAAAHVQSFESFSQFVTEGLARNPEIRDWVHFRPQTVFIYDAVGRNMLDFTGRFERLAEDYAYIAERLGKPIELPVTNRSGKGDYREAYTPAMVDVVRSLYVKDLDLLHYTFD